MSAAFALAVSALFVLTSAPPAAAAPCDPPITNPIACENTKPGSPPSEWDISGAGSDTIQGFATNISVNQGETVEFKVDTPASAYRLDIYRMGYYGGDGARLVTTVNPSVSLPQNQPSCLYQSSTGLTECGNWAVSASWDVPSDAVSGIYFAKLVRTDGTSGSSHVVFVIRDDDGGSDLLFQTSDTTWQAYNEYGGNSLYVGEPGTGPGRAYKVSYNRPFTTRSDNTEDWLFNAEYPMVRFLEANGYDVSYFTDVDTDRRGSELLEHSVFLSVGHDEYWSGQQRANVEAARDAGVHLAFFSGNEVFWKTRWESSIDGSGTPHRTLVTYKETHANDTIDPEDPPTWTGTWMDPRFSPPADGGRPQNELTGQLFGINCCTYNLEVDDSHGAMRLWRNTRAATLPAGGSTTLGGDLIGYESDIQVDNGFRPAGLVPLSATTINASEVLQDYGSSYGPETVTHSVTLYRAPSGALVFGAGTVQWAWGLDAEHDRGPSNTSDVAVQQATVNLFADMGVQPDTLQSGLVPATASTDTTAPTSTITSPANGATVPPKVPLTVSGTASDVGGLVGAVEVSVDGGATWHPAIGRASWSYTFTPTASGEIAIMSRATDDSARMETPGAGVTVTVGSGPPPPADCPCTIWSPSEAPANPSENDPAAVEGGVKFRADQAGVVTGVRFYKGSGNTGTHVGSLWTSGGTLLSSATFTGETATGWQQADFATPVPVNANTIYVASYYAPAGNYAADEGAFASAGVTRGPLTALPDGESGGNGVYRYGTGGGFPTNTYNATNYWVDVVFDTTAEDTTPPTLTAQTPAPDATGVPVGTSVTATFSEPVQESTITIELRGPGGSLVTGATTYDSGTRTVTLTPGSALSPSTAYTATVSGAQDAAGNTMVPVNWSFTTGAADSTPPTVVGQSPAPDATGVPVTTVVTATFSESVQSSTVVMELRGPGGALVPATTSYNAGTLTATLTPDGPLSDSTAYTATVSGAQDAAGNAMVPVIWTFTTGALGCPCTIWPATATPANPEEDDSSAVELGVKFRANQSGVITGIRFYKGAGNTGTHVGSLWTSGGALLASVTFTGETASGWQEAGFASPVSVTANTTYVASYYAPVGRYAADTGYFATATTNGPLTALADGTEGGNGVYRYGTGGGFPNSTYQATNYWVDVVFDASGGGGGDTTPPTVDTQSPAPGATGVSTSTTVSAAFNEDIQSATIVMELRGPGNIVVPSTVSYDPGTRTATLTPSAPLTESTVYTVNLSGATDTAGNMMTAVSWSFTTASGASGCPCTIWPAGTTPGVPDEDDSSAVELGVRFRADRDGVVTGIRFYKSVSNAGTHVGSLWTGGGTNLSSVIFTGETASGWQEALFSAPVPISANTTYVASYHAPTGHYAADSGYFSASGTTNGPLTALQDGVDGSNGVYLYGAGGFPTGTFQSSNYWVDVIFQTEANDTTPPTITARTPAVGASGVPVTATVTATFGEAVQEPTIVVELRDSGNNQVAGTTSYNATSRTVTFTPDSELAASMSHTVTVSGARDIAGNTMAPVSWSFTTAAPPPPPPPSEGPGGPIAVVTSATNPYSQYLAEILRAEGFNEFRTIDVGDLSVLVLAPYDIVIVGDVSITAAQASTLSTWVDGGGNLIAMSPDSDLSSLLGITPAGSTLAEAYLRIDSTTAPGAGLTTDTMQFHGTADRYSPSGAQTIATLYSTATTATTNPAVTLRTVGANGGQAASFTYDLARSVVYSRQGNPAWAGQERDGFDVIRSDDLYFGGAVADWVDLDKVAIPQADEQQRLLANLIEVMNRDRQPLPRFWYLPDSHKAVIVGTGDDHGNNGTSGRFDDLLAASPPGCSVADWTCPRFTSYVYPGTLGSAAANAYVAQGFEIALHPENSCRDFTSPADLADTYASDVSAFQQAFPNVPSPTTNRFHCLVWSDWASQASTELANGMRLDVNYYYWPGSWLQDRPGFMTGSGMPMRFTDASGGMIDVYQATTQMTDESDQTYPFTVNALLDNALGPLGYYGVFTANMHTDQASTFESDELLASAFARNVPVVTAKQMLTWLDGRNGSSFGDLDYSGDTLTFSVAVGSGATGLTGMVPVAGPGGATLTSLSRGGNPVAFTTETIKGQEYAIFAAAAGSYTATYSSGAGALALSAATVEPTDDGESAVVTWTSQTPSSTVVVYDEAGPGAGGLEAEAATALAHSLTLDELEPATTYTYRVISTDTAGQTATWPAADEPPASFTTPAADTKAPQIDRIAARPLPDGTAMVTWRTNEPATSEVTFGTDRMQLDRTGVDDELVTRHSVVVTGLEPDTTYWFSVGSADGAGNSAEPSKARRFASAAAGVADHSAVQFAAGAPRGTTVEPSEFGAITLAPGVSIGSFVSRVMDAQAMVTWDRAFWYAAVPPGAKLGISVRTGSTSRPDATWSAWTVLAAPGDRVEGDSRFIQYRVELVSSRTGRVPTLTAVGLTHNGNLPSGTSEIDDADG